MIKFENKENGRFYYLSVKKDLFDEWVLVIFRGGANSRVVRTFGFNCLYSIQNEINRIAKIRLKRGYTLID